MCDVMNRHLLNIRSDLACINRFEFPSGWKISAYSENSKCQTVFVIDVGDGISFKTVLDDQSNAQFSNADFLDFIEKFMRVSYYSLHGGDPNKYPDPNFDIPKDPHFGNDTLIMQKTISSMASDTVIIDDPLVANIDGSINGGWLSGEMKTSTRIEKDTPDVSHFDEPGFRRIDLDD